MIRSAVPAPIRPAPVPAPAPPQPGFGPGEAALLAEVLALYRDVRLARGHAAKTVAHDERLMVRAAELLALPPWAWREEHACRLGAAHSRLAISSQRRYASACRAALEFMSRDAAAGQRILERTGQRPRQVFHAGNTIPHRLEREVKAPRRELTPDELARLFGGLDHAILAAERDRSKALRVLERDKALFYLIYAAGLRASEALSVSLHAFSPAAGRPEMGAFGRVHVLGKGRKLRVIELVLPPLARLLDAYLEEVRPALARPGASDALILSERGRPLSYGALGERFRAALRGAGLDGRHLTVHSLRHSYASHLVEADLPMSVVQRLLGHAFLSTTQTYTHLSAGYQGRALRTLYDRALRAALPGGSRD